MTEALWSLAQAAAILAASWFVGGWLADIVGALLGQTRLDRMVRTLLVRLTKPLVMLVAVAAALSQMGVDIRVLLAILASGALALGLGLQDTVANLVAGGILFSRRPFRAGDTVTLTGIEGKVVGIGWLSVLVDEPDGARVIIPNRLVVGEPMRIRARAEED